MVNDNIFLKLVVLNIIFVVLNLFKVEILMLEELIGR